MRVGFVIDRWEPERGGAERALARLASHLLARSHDVAVYCLAADAGAPGRARVLDRPIRPRGSMEAAFGRAAVAAAADDGCDVTLGIRHLERIDVYWPHGGLHRETLAAGERAKGVLGGGVARTLHRMSLRHRAFLGLEQTLLAGGGASVVWCVSRMVRDELASAYAACEPRLEIHPNGADLATFRPALRDERREAFLARHRIDPSSPVLVFPGGNWGLKGWDVLMRALGLVRGPWTLVAAGDGARYVAPPAALRERVVLLPRQDPRDLWGAADVCVQPTWRDPCSLASLEALASGVAVVTTTANGASDAALAGGGAAVPPGDPERFAGAVECVLARLGPETRRAARDAVADRPVERWLEALEASLVRAATCRP